MVAVFEKNIYVLLAIFICFCIAIEAQDLNHEFESAKSRQRELKDKELMDKMDNICENAKNERGLKHMAQCVVQYSPKQILIMMEYCKRKVYGNVKFDVIMKGYCDDGIDKIMDWFECQEQYARYKYKKNIMDMFEDPENQKYRFLLIKCMTMDSTNYKG